MFLCRELTSETEIEVGKIFNRDYSTVIAAIRSLVSMMESDAALARRVQDLRYMLET
jgi:chromosomal replication initiator protein